ncbi:pyrroline-5-carboxylate reductase family protein [Roseibium aggregatum]|uniref:Pyrroline-5-carboxylate reductase n=1 Tax=Roseibium aggregatum TaxID=187304 RepID=A0A939EC21_9HYPH|nr:pyrroline-5-carboxylate reductase [Roseibium aggregatum]MBN9669323.1 pyrroline-5-carboxylate reductase [Roseibium aggregatum]
MTLECKIGIIGGSGQLGSAIAEGWLSGGSVRPENLWISNRSGRSSRFLSWPNVTFTTSNQELTDACDVILLSVPPALTDTIAIAAPEKLVISVMAGVSLEALSQLTGTKRAVRAMSSPAAALGLAYSPWFAAPGLSDDDRLFVSTLLSACGSSDEVPEENQIDVFTAITGPAPGFVAYFADCMVKYALANGVEPDVAVRAVKQLFLASGEIMSRDTVTPDTRVKETVDYAGTTAAGLVKLKELGVEGLIAEGLGASTARARTIAQKV